MMDINDTSITLRLASPRQCHVLVVDDDDLVRSQLSSLLRLAGYETHGVASGEEALLALSARPCDIVITDWELPGMDGLALCRALRLRDCEHYTYVLMLTVRGQKNDILTGLGAGADDYLVKGAPSEEVLARAEVGRRITRLEHSLRVSGEENRRLSVTDPLTGAQNRRFLMKYLPRELERSRRYQRPLAILSCDIDEFKRVNDTFGHEAGDEVLQAFVVRSMACLRESIDWIARAGGEEFVVVLPETNLAGASRVAEKLRNAFACQAIGTSAGPLSVTTSIGATAVETQQELAATSVIELLRAADQCLYASKNLGRDRITCEAPALTTAAMYAPTGRVKHEIN